MPLSANAQALEIYLNSTARVLIHGADAVGEFVTRVTATEGRCNAASR